MQPGRPPPKGSSLNKASTRAFPDAGVRPGREGLTFSYEGDRFDCGEQRFITLGLLAGVPVSIAHTESDDEVRDISLPQSHQPRSEALLR